ncbi:MAG TPA: aspartate aminotransferase family protein [Candidatus Tyrphobacter sp.]|nr:aspartate aminotransferase family protein [Candidatus Tyrphobacter sp.]
MFKKYHLAEDAKIKTSSIPGPKSIALLKKQEELESQNRSYPRGIPLAFGRAKGSVVEDVDGNQYIDFISGCGVFNLGHNNSYIIDGLKKSEGLITQAVDFPTEAKIVFMEKLSKMLPPSLRGNIRINFGGPTGSDAIEAALKLARIVKGRQGIMAFQGGYHGMTTGALSVTSRIAYRNGSIPLDGNVSFMPYCSPYRCPFAKNAQPCGEECIKYFQNCLENPHSGISKPAAILLEPVQGEGGTYIPTKGWLEKIVEIAHRNDVLVIFDEVQSGFFRTGKLFASEHTNALPDIVAMSKGIGGNGYPLSLILYKKELDVWAPGTHIGTFRGNQLAMAAGSLAMEFIQKFNVEDHVKEMSSLILERLMSIKKQFFNIGDVRGIGMMFGIEYVKNKETKEPFPEMARAVKKRCYENGLLIEIGGYYGNVLRFLPALIITPDLIANGLAIFEKANIQAS